MRLEELEFLSIGPVWHICTPGELKGVIFQEREDYIYGMNLIALCAATYKTEMKILTFQLMSNHIHLVVACKEEAIDEFFSFLAKKLHRYLAASKRAKVMHGFICNKFKIGDLKYLQAVITYVNRNGFLTSRNYTPFSYEWGANRYFFNNTNETEQKQGIDEVSIETKRKIFRTREVSFPKKYYFSKEYISPACYCHLHTAEGIFRDAAQYFHLVSRQVESYTIIAQELGDRITYTDEEIYSAIISICKKKYDSQNPTTLPKEQKIELAKTMHYDFNANNKQIKRILRMEESIIDALFPPKSARTTKAR